MRRLVLLLIGVCCWVQLAAQQADALRENIAKWVEVLKPMYASVGDVRLERTRILTKSSVVEVYLNGAASYMLYRESMVDSLYASARAIVHRYYPRYQVVIYADKKRLEFYVPNAERCRLSLDKSRYPVRGRTLTPLVRNLSLPYSVERGLVGRNIALWSSHGLYYNQLQDRWRWQRARLFSTVEDKLTLHYVLNYLVPMLENAGACVMLPHERDTQPLEVVVDNDVWSGQSSYEEYPAEAWRDGGHSGFAPIEVITKRSENPFCAGTYRFARTSREATASVKWMPNLPAAGNYAVYVSYQTVEASIDDALYVVHHAGGVTEFKVNQQQGGGTWIYLGNFFFDAGSNPMRGCVELKNGSRTADGVVTADAVRFGGGMGSVARKPAEAQEVVNYNALVGKRYEVSPYAYRTEPVTSGVPRYLEGARYWLQTAGFAPKVFSRTHGVDDYIDDVSARALWVNALNNGSVLAPDSAGLAIPIDLSLGLHTDAGVKMGDSIVGSLGIFTAPRDEERFADGVSRYVSRELSDGVLTALSRDISSAFGVDWNIRGIWNKGYIEARLQQVPAMLLELLSHQNFTDMRLALDPHFQFVASRAIYKAVLEFVSQRYGVPYVVQPLPVAGFAVERMRGDSLLLSWQPTVDTLTASGALPTGYVVYKKELGGGYDNGTYVSDTSMVFAAKRNVLYSFKVCAVNDGGKSFDSEELCAYVGNNDSVRVLLVNGFDRVSAPDFFATEQYCGLSQGDDCGVPYHKSLSYTGAQYDFERSSLWISDDAPGCGASMSTYDAQTVCGNNFSAVVLHGKALQQAGYSFVSCSRAAVEQGRVHMSNYDVVDLILGKQRSTLIGLDTLHMRYEAMSPTMQRCVEAYCNGGGALLVSGAHLSSDVAKCGGERFLARCLHVAHNTSVVGTSGRVVTHLSPLKLMSDTLQIRTSPTEQGYHVNVVDAFLPQKGAIPVLKYADTGTVAAVAYKGIGRQWVMGFPLEVLIEERQRSELMLDIMNFLVHSQK